MKRGKEAPVISRGMNCSTGDSLGLLERGKEGLPLFFWLD